VPPETSELRAAATLGDGRLTWWEFFRSEEAALAAVAHR